MDINYLFINDIGFSFKNTSLKEFFKFLLLLICPFCKKLYQKLMQLNFSIHLH